MKLKILVILLSAVVLTSCRYGRGIRGNGQVVKKEFSVSNFNKIEMGGIYNLDITIGEPRSVIVRAEKNLMKYLKIRVKNNRLILSSKRNISPRKGIKVEIVTNSLKEIQASGASFAEVKGVDENNFLLDISGASKVEISGVSKKLELSVSGAGKLYAKKFICKKVLADISGAAGAIINATEKLRADVSGAASLSYYGDPKNISYDISGAGSIRKK